MTTNFTLRDFFVYILTGITMLNCIGIIFFKDLLEWSTHWFSKYELINNFSFLVFIFAIPIIYLIGHVIGFISYNLLKIYIWLDKNYFKKPISKCKYFILIKLQQILYRQRVVYAIISHTKSENSAKYFTTVDEFWTECAKLKIEKSYDSSEYWYVLNELFNSLNLVFFISAIISALNQSWTLSVIYFALTIFAFKRAKQYAEHFTNTVIRTIKVSNSINQ